MIRSRLAWTRRRFSARRSWPLPSAWAMRRRLVAACRRWICRNSGGGLEVRAGEAGVGVRAVLLGRAAAVAVGQAVADAVEVVLDPLGRRGRERRGRSRSRSPAMLTRWRLVAVERLPDGGVVDLGVVAGHVRAGVAEELLDDVLGDAGVDQPGPERVAELVAGHGDRLPGLVVQADDALPAPQLLAEGAVRVGLGAVVVAGDPGEQPRAAGGPALAHVVLLGGDGRRGLGAERDRAARRGP